MFAKISDRDLGEILSNLMQARVAKTLCKEHGIEITKADIEREYENSKKSFAAKPQFQDVPFEDLLRQQTGMSPDAYKASSGFFTVVAVYLVGTKLVPDEDAARIYEEDKDWYGPISEVRHILLRGSDDAAFKDKVRARAAALAEAQKVKERIDKGESFDELVKLMSDDVRSKFKDGVMAKWTPREWGSMSRIAESMKTMKVGDVAGPIESADGYHIIKLAAIEPAPPLSPEIVRDMRKRRALAVFQKRWSETRRGVDLRRMWPRPQKPAATSKPS
jgi:foldase protein PrsA